MAAYRGLESWYAATLAELQALGTTNQGVAVGHMGVVTGASGTGLYRCSAVATSSSTWAITGGGSGDVVGPGSATDNAIARFDSTTGKLIQNSAVTVDDSGNLAGVGTINGTSLASLGGWTLKYSIDFGAIATSVDLTASGDTTYSVDGTNWVVLGTANVTAADVFGADGAGTGLVVDFNGNNPSSWAFQMSALLTDLDSTIDVNEDLRIFIQYTSNADASFETIGARLLTTSTLSYTSGSGNLYAAGMGVGSSPYRAYIERGTAEAPVQPRTPLNYSSNTTDCMCLEFVNGVLGTYLINTAGGALPTDLSDACHVGSYNMGGPVAGGVATPTNANTRLALCAFPGNTGANFDPTWTKISIYQRG